MTPLAAAIAAYCTQVMCVVAVAATAALLLGEARPWARLLYWRGVGTLCLALPALSVAAVAGGHDEGTFTEASISGFGVGAPASSSVTLSAVVLWILGAGVAARLIWLVLGMWRLGRLRSASVPAELGEDLEALRVALAPHAELRWTEQLHRPAAFGLSRHTVLLPRQLADMDPDGQRAVVCHELTHVARGDWPWIVAEEVVRSIFWFHPAIWWVIDRLHLSREQLIDEQVVGRTGARKAYMQALLTFADAAPTGVPSLSFLRRRHVAARLTHLSKEVHMSRIRLVGVAAGIIVLLGAVTQGVVSAVPADFGAVVQAGASRLELRLAEEQPAAGLVESEVAPGRRVYLHPEVLAGSSDVTSARVVPAENGRFSVETTFNSAASARLTAATRGHIGRPLAVIVDGRLVAAPIVRSAVGSTALLTGAFTQRQAESIVAGLADGNRAAPQGVAQSPFSADDAGVVLPIPTRSVKAFYPAAALDAKIVGAVELSAVVKADGTVGDVVVTKSLDTAYGLDQSAVDSVKQWLFTPGSRDGQAVPVRVSMLVRFDLK
ncbi:MAG: TonB family protein [Vicinamibacterales bacterium]